MKSKKNLFGHIDHSAVFFCHFINPFAFMSPTTVFNLGQLEVANWQAGSHVYSTGPFLTNGVSPLGTHFHVQWLRSQWEKQENLPSLGHNTSLIWSRVGTGPKKWVCTKKEKVSNGRLSVMKLAWMKIYVHQI